MPRDTLSTPLTPSEPTMPRRTPEETQAMIDRIGTVPQPLNQKERAAVRKALSHHPQWEDYRLNPADGRRPVSLANMTARALIQACDDLRISIDQIRDEAARPTQLQASCTKLRQLGYVWVNHEWQKKPEW